MPPRSAWQWVETWPVSEADDHESQLLVRNAGDGMLTALISIIDNVGWSCTVSFISARETTRYPTWEETLDAVHQLLPHDLDFVVHLQPAVEGNIASLHMQQHPSPRGTVQ